jgi:diguanylate cyclase (GGDEF)-like protein
MPGQVVLSSGHAFVVLPLTITVHQQGAVLIEQRDDHVGLSATLGPLCTHFSTALQNAQLYEMAISDDLTKLYRRRYYDAVLNEMQVRGTAYSVILIDLNRFKAINDQFGHAVGDAVLCEVGRALRQTLRLSELAARIGGDEFAVVVPEPHNKNAERVVSKLRAAIEAIQIDVPGAPSLRIDAAFGTAASHEGCDARAVEELADRRLYKNKYQMRE